MRKIIFICSITLIFLSCAGTINTVKPTVEIKKKYKNAYILSAENSAYIKFKFGTITPWGYIIKKDDPAEKQETIGNTAAIIKAELAKNGITSEIGKKGDMPTGFDFIVQYNDTWRWDFKKILDKLEIAFVTKEGDSVIAKSTFNIYKNKELHNFPTPEKEVPKMIKELLSK